MFVDRRQRSDRNYFIFIASNKLNLSSLLLEEEDNTEADEVFEWVGDSKISG